ncbi:hypothetical protein ASD02_06885 [Ensifer sp. Root1252]|jgi:hypothetical protein|nr:hypothetical protein ASD00_37300 [Ensifer sp. Root31]KQW58700.1 hypothetical protein ASD02_06885 [Ensifer sp. Root1252]KQW74405.1 hypothetical protein ASD03_07525 [Ensifer sp. Root127]KRC67536.1 hypothetical protein ASE32_10345 [Ensifer sp. Root231]KRC98613.1 hypothetical protein ASE47_05540 [Ensifer sp. Root258]OMQ41623.1 hypothetical protein BKP54_28245 [Ensifer sp. 1H6]
MSATASKRRWRAGSRRRQTAHPAARFAEFAGALKRVAIFQIRLPRFKFLFLRMSLSQNRSTLLRDML